MPAKAGIQNYSKTLDSRLRGNDAKGRFKTFYETINDRLAAIRWVSSHAIETLSQPAVRNQTLIDIKLTERSDIHKYSIFNLQSSILSRSKTIDYDVCTNCIAFETMAEA